MISRKILVCLAICFLVSRASGQTSLGDSDDRTALVLDNGGAISINFADSSAKAGYLHKVTGEPLSFGIEISGRTVDGYGALLDGLDLAPEAAARLLIGFQPVKHQTEAGAIKEDNSFIRDQWLFLQCGFRHGEYNMLDTTRPVDSQLTKETQDSPAVGLVYNSLLRGNILAGLSFQFSRENNYDNLAKKSATDRQTVVINGSSERIVEEKITAREGVFSEFDEYQGNADIMWVPGFFSDRIGIDFFLRYTDSTETKPAIDPGAGLFVLEKGAPSRIIAGITAKRDDLDDRMKIGFVAGYNF